MLGATGLRMTRESRVTRENERMLARYHKSLQAERAARESRRLADQQRQQEREMMVSMRIADREERDRKIIEKNERYAEMWIATVGLAVPQMISALVRGGDLVCNAHNVRVYNKLDKKVEELNVLNLLKQLVEANFPELSIHRGQVIFKHYVLAARVFYFMRFHWVNSGAINQSFPADIMSKTTVSPATTPSV